MRWGFPSRARTASPLANKAFGDPIIITSSARIEGRSRHDCFELKSEHTRPTKEIDIGSVDMSRQR